MKANSLPIINTSFFRLIQFLKREPKLKFIENKINNELVNFSPITIENIGNCDNQLINQIFKKILPYSKYVNVFLHGSYADNTTTNFSDIDDYIVLDIENLKKDNLLSQVLKLLNKIDMQFCRIDPIQHHGHWISSKNELTNYDNSFIPLHILNDSKCVMGENFVKGIINSDTTKEGLKRNIINTCKGIENLSELYFNKSINAYQLKQLVGSFALMPAFIMQIKGYDCTKPEAISLSDNILSESARSCIKWSTNNRLHWHIITINKKYKTFGLISYLFFDPYLWRRFSEKFSPKVSEKQKKNLSKEILTLKVVEQFILESQQYAK